MNTSSLLSPEADYNLRQLGWSEWVEQTQQALPRLLAQHRLRPIQALYGGKMGFCFLAKDQQGNQVVVKGMPNPSLQRQALALEAMNGWHAPVLAGQDLEGGILWTEYLEGTDRPEKYSEAEAVDIIAGWDRPAPAGLPSVAERFSYWVDFMYQTEVDDEPRRIVDQVDSMLSQMPEGERLLHGDLSWHNTLRHANGDLYILDPAGYRGHVEWDIACMGLYHGPRPQREKAEQLIQQYCDMLGADVELAREYCAVRTAFSMARSVRRQELGKTEQAIDDFQYWIG